MSIDTNSATWAAVKAHVDKAIEAARQQLEAAGLGPVETESIRGEIKALRGVLAMVTPQPGFESTDPGYH